MKNFTLLVFIFASVALCRAYVQITDDNFSELVQKEDEWVLDFYAEWCEHCKRLEPKFRAADQSIAKSTYKHVKLGAVNIDTNPGLSARFFISRLPTLIHIKDHEARIIPQPKTGNDIVTFVTLEEWRNVKPQSGLRSPFSLFGKSTEYSGEIIRKLSSYSPFTIVSVFTGFLLFTVILPVILIGPNTEDEAIHKKEDKEVNSDSLDKKSESRATIEKTFKTSSASRRKEKRVE